MLIDTTTLPKPFVFVLMPFAPEFADIYKFGIKGAAEDVGVYAERLDEQIFTEGMLERIFNQISKADVIVADMTGRNPNVFYEVGYAHALGKIVLLLTQNAEDIPFDFKHRQHTVYGGSIELLRKELAQKLQWAVSESRKQLRPGATERFSIRLVGNDIPRSGLSKDIPLIFGEVEAREFSMPIQIRNDSLETVLGITHIYLFAQENAPLVPSEYHTIASSSIVTAFTWESPYTLRTSGQAYPIESFTANPIDAPDGLVKQYRLRVTFPALPPGAVEVAYFGMMFSGEPKDEEAMYRLRLHSQSQYHEYPFRLQIKLREKSKEETERTGNVEDKKVTEAQSSQKVKV